MKMVIVELHPEILRNLLKLPDGARMVRVESDVFRPDTLRILLQNVGYETPEGNVIRVAPPAEIHSDGTISWNLPQ